jgi:hypothetical protein
MALTDFQRAVCRLLADHRISSGESYVAGCVALNEIMATSRISRGSDLFHPGRVCCAWPEIKPR